LLWLEASVQRAPKNGALCIAVGSPQIRVVSTAPASVRNGRMAQGLSEAAMEFLREAQAEMNDEPVSPTRQHMPHLPNNYEKYQEYLDSSPAECTSSRARAAAAEYLGLQTPGDPSQNDHINMAAVEALRQMYEISRSGARDWHNPRPKSARYMAPRCRMTPDGGGGAPLQRPCSAPAGRRPAKTERWRESGMRRWPKESDKTQHTSDPSDGDPLRRRPVEPQPNWTGELWTRSLRRPGMEIQDPAYHDVGQRGIREIQEEWQAPRPQPKRPQSAREGNSFARSAMRAPYGGSTATGKVALPRRHNMQAWVERPVATGKMSLKHHHGARYTFSQEPRGLEWNEYVKNLNPAR